ncbi:hypothetical protein [Isoptericola sp. NPDC055881]
MSEMTARQARDWPSAVAEVQRHVTNEDVPTDLARWTVVWAEEIRPGRGQDFTATWLTGDHVAQVRMGVYGTPDVAVGEVDWLHSSADEACGCEECAGRWT